MALPPQKVNWETRLNIKAYVRDIKILHVVLPLYSLCSRIKEEKEKEEPKTIPLRVYGKGLGTFAVVSLHRCFKVLHNEVILQLLYIVCDDPVFKYPLCVSAAFLPD